MTKKTLCVCLKSSSQCYNEKNKKDGNPTFTGEVRKTAIKK